MAGWVQRGHPCQGNWALWGQGWSLACPDPLAVDLSAVWGWMPAAGEGHPTIRAGRWSARLKMKCVLTFQAELQSSWWGPSRDQPINREPCDAHPLLTEKRKPNQQMFMKYPLHEKCWTETDVCWTKISGTINKTITNWIQRCIERLRWDEWNLSQLCKASTIFRNQWNLPHKQAETKTYINRDIKST